VVLINNNTMKTKTLTPVNKQLNEVVSFKKPVRTTYISKWERYVINQCITYWMKNSPKSELELMCLDKFKEVQNKFNQVTPETVWKRLSYP
jgi:hypothetical protein